jgi:hypothetical protein
VRASYGLPIGPGSFIEVTKILSILTATEPGQPSFHVVAPNLPGYAWSQGVSDRGFREKQYAEVRGATLGKPCAFPC